MFVGFESERKQAEGLEALPTDHPHIHRVSPLPRRSDVWEGPARQLRSTIDYLRYLHPRLSRAAYLRGRMQTVLPRALAFAAHVESLSPAAVNRLIRLYRRMEAAIPPARAIIRYVRAVEPDVVVVSPLVTDASPQTDVVKAAHELGIPVVLAVASWDHLTTKGLLRVVPDRVIVWNETQREEAETLHAVPSDRIVATGAQPFDRWFERSPALSRREFAERVGLPPEPPFLLFVGSTASISEGPAERRFVENWLSALRADSALGDLPVMIRPHPYNFDGWLDADLSGFGNVVVWPLAGPNPVNEADREDYFHSLTYAAAVVGINTSAMIEAAIQGTPVLTVRSPEFRETQELTVHFRYLLSENGGFLRSSSSLEEHLGQLSEVLADPERSRCEAAQFVERFVRPRGRDEPALPGVVSAILQAASHTPKPPPPSAPVFRPLVAAFGIAVYLGDPALLRAATRRQGKRWAKRIKQKAKRYEKGSRRRRSLERVATVVSRRADALVDHGGV